MNADDADFLTGFLPQQHRAHREPVLIPYNWQLKNLCVLCASVTVFEMLFYVLSAIIRVICVLFNNHISLMIVDPPFIRYIASNSGKGDR